MPRVPWVSGAAIVGWLWLAALVVLQLAGADVRRHHLEAPGLLLVVGVVVLAAWAARRESGVAVAPGAPPLFVTLVPAAAALAAFGWALTLGPAR